MTVQTTSSKAGPFTGNGVTDQWSTNFIVDKAADLTVIYTDPFGVETVLDPAQYSVAGFGDPAGVTVTYPLSGPPIGASQKITLLREVNYDQQTSITNQGGFYPQVIEKALDRIVFQCQQLAEKVGRAITVSVSSGEDPNAAFQSIAINAAIAQEAASDANGSAGEAAASAAAAAASAASIEKPIPVASGGTGATDAAGARANLGIIDAFESFIVAVTPETGAAVVANPAFTFRMPYAFTLASVSASLVTAQTSGSPLTIDIRKNDVTVLSTLLTFDNAENTTATASVPAVISVPGIAANDKITLHVTQIGDGTAKGLKVYLVGRQ